MLVEAFIKVMNGLVMTLEEGKILMLCYVSNVCRFTNGDVKIMIKSHFMEVIVFLNAFCSIEVLAKKLFHLE